MKTGSLEGDSKSAFYQQKLSYAADKVGEADAPEKLPFPYVGYHAKFGNFNSYIISTEGSKFFSELPGGPTP